MDKELTNGGKPHICNTIQIFNGTKKDVARLCGKCKLPVDIEPTKKE